MAKPFSIQSPEEIAKEYGGNKRKIGEAMQMGIVDPTAGVLAGMFIDRMRSAQMQEMTPQATVAQQVMGGLPPAPAQIPPAPHPGAPAGLGALAPQGGEQMAMPQEAPMPMPQEAPMGMAMGGLAGLPVPDNMFDEPTNGGFDDGYAGGGLVAFATGGPALEEEFDATFGRSAQPAAPSYYGYSVDPRQNMAIARELMGTPESKYSDMVEKDLLETLNPAAVEKRRKGRKADFLTELGLRLLGTDSPNFATAIGKAGMGVLPGAREAARLDKEEQRFARKALADLEAGRNTQKAQIAAQALQMQQTAIQGYEAQTGRDFQASQNQLNRDLDWRIATLQESGRAARAASSGSGGGGGGGSAATKPLSAAQTTERLKILRKQAEQSLAAAREFDKAGAYGNTEKALGKYGDAARAYNQLAASAGMPGLPATKYNVPNYNKYVAQRGQHPSGKPTGAGKGRQQQSSGKLPAGVTQAEWNAMTPQERALFR